jgi:hypothetical protein
MTMMTEGGKSMAERVCAKCGKSRKLEGAKICENNHFICKICVSETLGLFSGSRTKCPLCQNKLS